MKRVLVLGAGMVSSPLVHYLLDHEIHVTLCDIREEAARKVAGNHPNAVALQLDSGNANQVEGLVPEADLVISLLPPPMHPKIAEVCLAAGKHFLTASYLSPEMEAMNDAVAAKGLIFMNEIGLDPGLDHLTAMEMIDDARDHGYQILGFDSHCGGIPSRKAANNPLRYKFSWSPVGVLGALSRPSKFKRDGKVVVIPGQEMLHNAEVLRVPQSGIYESTPNADSLYYGERYGLTNAQTVRRGTLRYPGWAQFWLFMQGLDFLNRENKIDFKEEQVLSALFKTAGYTPPDDIFAFVYQRSDKHASVFLEGLESLGLLDPNNRITGSFSAFDIILKSCLEHMNYEPGETDLVVLHHEFIVEKDGQREKWTSTIIREGEPSGVTAMAFLVGVPAAIAAKLILDGKISQRGVLIPLERECYQPLLAELTAMGLPHKITKQPLS